jgi:hypothetical protein
LLFGLLEDLSIRQSVNSSIVEMPVASVSKRAAAILALVLLTAQVSLAGQASSPRSGQRLVVLSDTGQVRDGLRVFGPHPADAAISADLLRGFPARMVRLYEMEQAYLRHASGSTIEPAYLVFSTRQGGFPGVGFWLGNEAKRQAGFVDLYNQRRRWPRFGGVDQIFPHELAHVMMRQLAGEPPRGGATQGHAIGVRTDPVMAFEEGFAEHFQVMALDDPDADPGTRGLLADPYWLSRVNRDGEAYREAMTARWSPAARARLMFLFWYSAGEQVWRYHAVKANAFARQPAIPPRLLTGRDPYAAYLLENVLPGVATDPPRTAAQMLATEGVVSTLFWRWATSEALRSRYLDEAFYAPFGVARRDVPAELNVYLKLFHVFHAARPRSARAAIEAYQATFPEEASALDAVVREGLLGQALPAAPEIWLANPAFSVGTRVFDQFRAAPQVHTFDLNAASLVDLVGVPGVDMALAEKIRHGAPYASLADLRRVSGITDDLHRRFETMAGGMAQARAAEEGASSLFGLLWSFGVRALAVWLLAAAVGGVLFKRVRQCGWPRAILSGLGAALVTLAAAWLEGSMSWAAGAPLLLLAAPALLFTLRRRPLAPALAATALAWLSAIAPALVLVTPMF